MNLKTNITPEHFVPVCTAPRNHGLIKLNLYLRENGIDARYVSGKDEAMIKVPPLAKLRAERIVTSWVHERPNTGIRHGFL